MKCTECPDYRECSRTRDLRRYRGKCAKAKDEKIFTIADHIRSMDDEELANAIYELINGYDPATWFCKGTKECEDLMETDEGIPAEMCKACLLQALRQPHEKTRLPKGMYLDKQESGLLEED